MVEEIENAENEIFVNGKKLLDLLVVQLPGKSISFLLDEKIYEAVGALVTIAEEKLPKNMPKIQATALETLKPLIEQPANTYVNMNLTEEDIRALNKVLEYVEREI